MTLSLCAACFCFGMAVASFIDGKVIVGCVQMMCAAVNVAMYLLVKG